MTKPPLRFSCVIFDMDGTLTQTNELIFASFNHVTKKYLDKTMTPAEIVALFGPPEEGAIANLFGGEIAKSAIEDLCDYYRTNHESMAFVHTGVDAILQHLRDRGVRLAVFTGKGMRTASITLDALGLTKYFDMVISGTDVVNHKPHPEGIQKIVKAFALDPSQVLMVGDALADITASRSAGVKIASVLWDSYDRERVMRAEADFIFHSVEEMFDWVRLHIN